MAAAPSPDMELKLFALGDCSVGKTSILCRFVEWPRLNTRQQQLREALPKLPDLRSTVGVDFRQRIVNCRARSRPGAARAAVADCSAPGATVQVQLWDTSGQERFRALCTTFFRDVAGFMLVYDCTQRESLHNLERWMEIVRDHAYCESPDIVLCANKCDLRPREDTLEEGKESTYVSSNQGRQAARRLGAAGFFETSALTGEGVENAVICLLDAVLRRIRQNKQLTRLHMSGGEGSLQIDNTKQRIFRDVPPHKILNSKDPKFIRWLTGSTGSDHDDQQYCQQLQLLEQEREEQSSRLKLHDTERHTMEDMNEEAGCC